MAEQDDLRRTLQQLSDRLARIEFQLGIDAGIEEEALPTAADEPAGGPVPPGSAADAPEHVTGGLVEKQRAMRAALEGESTAEEPDGPSPAPSGESSVEATFVPPVVEPPRASAAPPEPAPPTEQPRAPATEAPPIAPPVVTPVTMTPVPTHAEVSRRLKPPRKPRDRMSMEMLIGGNWTAWLGAAVVFLAALFAVKIAIDQGWWGVLSPQMKFLIIGVCGALLTGAGEIVLRRVGKAASIGLFSAGLGVLYLDCFASFHYWSLCSKEWAFLLMGVVALGGFALTYRTRMLTIGVLSIVGGFLTPVLLRGQSAHDLEMLSFLTVLLGVSLGLAGTLPKPFGPLRYVALGCLSPVALGWLIANGPGLWLMGIIFMSLWWAMILFEAVVAAGREHSTQGNIVITFLATAGYICAGCWVLSTGPSAGTDWTGVFTAMIAVAAAMVALNFGAGLRGLKVFPRRALDKLVTALWIQAGILIATAVALHFDEYGRAAGWLIIGLGAIESGRRLPSRGLDIFGLVVGAIGLFDVAFVSWWIIPTLTNPIRQWGNLTITGWAILAMVAVLVTHVAAHRLNDHWPNTWKRAPIVLATLAALGWLAWWLLQAEGLMTTTGWLIGAAILMSLHRFGSRQRYFEIAQLLLFAAALRWVVVDLFHERFERTWDPFDALPVVNARTALALAIAAAGWWVQVILRQREKDGTASRFTDTYGFQVVRQGAVLFMVLVAMLALSFDADRIVERLARADAAIEWITGHVRQNVLTLVWSAGSLVLGLAGRFMTMRPGEGQRPPRLLAFASSIILAVCLFKWLAFDTLFWLLGPRHDVSATLLPILNVQMFTGLAIAMTGLLLRHHLFAAFDRTNGAGGVRLWRDPAAWLPVGASLVLLWGASFEVDRIIARGAQRGIVPTYDPALVRMLWWTALWAGGGLIMKIVGAWRKQWLMFPMGGLLIVGGAGAWLTFDTIGWRFTHSALDVPIIINLQCLVGVGVALILFGAKHMTDRLDAPRRLALFGETRPALVAQGLLAALGLWLGSMELDRLFAADVTVRLASFSVYWGLYAVVLIAIGFVRRIAVVRYAGLALLAVTAIKVLFIDMAEAKNIWRVVSFAACGLLLIVTSIAYAKLGERLKGETTEEANAD